MPFMQIRRYQFLRPALLPVALLALFAVGVLAISVAAQKKKPAKIKPQVFELKNGKAADTSTAKLKPKPAGKTNPFTTGRRGVAMNTRRWATRVDKLALDLDRAAADAFGRGLMPMRHFARQLAVSERLLVAASRLRKNERRERAAVDYHARQLTEAARRLKALKQPAAKGWAAEVALAEFLAARTRDRAIAHRRGKTGQPPANAATAAAAMKYFKLVKDDHSVGLADDRQLADAAVRAAEVATGKRDAGIRAWEEVRRAVADRAEKLVTIPGDHLAVDLQHLYAVKEFAAAKVAAAGGKKAAADRHLLESEQHRRKEFRMLLKRTKTGTAALYDLAESWSARQQTVAALSRRHKVATDALADDLQSLVRFSKEIDDSRGRNDADLLFVQALQELWQLPAENAAAGSNPTAKSRSRIQPKVFDLKPRERQP